MALLIQRITVEWSNKHYFEENTIPEQIYNDSSVYWHRKDHHDKLTIYHTPLSWSPGSNSGYQAQV